MVDPNGHPPHQKANRLRKACDSCSIRKVKCDESGPPCRACAALDIPCTFERPSRRRGPPNRHAEAIKKRRLESPNNLSPTSPSSPTNAAHALAALSSHPTLSADSIAPIDTIELLINDYFTYIHPLCPFPHEPTFRESFRMREDYHNRMFLALLASMISVLVAAFPRKPRLHLKAQGRQNLFPNHMSLIDRCQQVCYAARGSDWLQREDLNVYDAATSYLLGVSYAYTLRWRQSRRYFAEAMTIVRGIGLDNAKEQYYEQPGTYSREGELAPDFISQEMGKRIFWTTFVSWRSMSQGGATHDELVILPETPSKPYPRLPVEVDDNYIFPTHIAPQPEGLLSTLAGFNANVRVYRSYSALATTELAYGINEVFDWERQSKVLEQGLRNCKQVLLDLPPELTVWPDGEQLNQATHGFYPPPPEYMRAKEAGLQQLLPPEGEISDLERHKTGYEIQKANIYISQLATRSYITERYFSLREIYENMKSQNQDQSSPAIGTAGLDTVLHHEPSPNLDQMETDMQAEKDKIVKDLLHVLGSISQIHMEPNADSFTHKVRQIVSPLLNMPQDRKSSVAQQAEQYLHHFLDILVRLDRNTGASRSPDAPEDEEAELKHWADLRDYQIKFTESGGILALR
ncbi:hypothetical protein K490DRAFT_39756 [Saccharata proteae CBS 121410]|uniref:Zn(2)-C6 fungal-type domain-containing protein n=1 Tax=Saccharata proteae CBS 121410 TaxID=1314787 RepID=A0A9P4HXJ3_9PEZI|nr:hypothetical protein K490DRAFT_39756 [Saccharata proteae CBS 121410]